METPTIINSEWSSDDIARVLGRAISPYATSEGEVGTYLSSEQINNIIRSFGDWTENLPEENQTYIKDVLDKFQMLLGSLRFGAKIATDSDEILDVVETAIFAVLFGLEYDFESAEEFYPLFELFMQTYIFLKLRQTIVDSKDIEERLLNEDEIIEFARIVRDQLEDADLDKDTIRIIIDKLSLLLQILPIDTRLSFVLAREFSNNVFILFDGSDWVPRPGDTEISGADHPRYLTDEEVEDILENIPTILSASLENALSAQKSLLSKLRPELKEVKICPSSIGEFKADIITRFERSRVTPGTNVGIIAANAIGEQTTQMTLNTFHSAGGDTNISQGITALTELIYARRSRRYPSCTVVFKKRMTGDQIFQSSAGLVQTTIQDLLVSYDITNVEEMEQYYWHALFPNIPSGPYQHVLRLRLDPVRMLERRIIMEDVVKTLIGESTPSSIYIAHSSTSEGILDIYANPKRIRAAMEKIQKQLQQKREGVPSFRSEYSGRVFLSNIIQPNLKNMRIKGIADIINIFPVKNSVWSIILKERKPTEKEMEKWDLESDENLYVLEFDPTKLLISPIRPEHLYEFLETLDMRVIIDDPNYFLIETSNVSKEDPVPSKIRDEYLKMAKEKFVITGERDPILDLENYYHATTRGSNITRLLQKKEIDPYYTYCNDIHAMIKLLGVEAARQFFIKELSGSIRSSGGYVNARHITLTADTLFKQGIFLGTNYTGMYNGSAGYFSLSTHQRCTQTLSRAATFSEKEGLGGTSSAIAVGAIVRSGTGFMDVIPTGPDIMTSTTRTRSELEPASQLEEFGNPMFTTSTSCPDDLDVLMSLRGPKQSEPVPKVIGRIPSPDLSPKRTIAQDLASRLKPTREAPTTLVVSENLQEAMDKIYLGPEVEETEILEQVSTFEVPSEIQQAPIASFMPSSLAIPGIVPDEFPSFEIAPLVPIEFSKEPTARIRYIDAPIMYTQT